MTRAAILACWPWLATLIVLVVGLRLTVRLNQTQLEWRRLAALHADQGGGSQTLSFVLTLPLFIMVMLLIVQVSQLMIGTIVVHYAAFAAARAAIVWIPANLGYTPGGANVQNAENYIGTIPDPDDLEPHDGYKTYYIAPTEPRWEKVRMAAVLACMPICPSRDGAAQSAQGDNISKAVQTVYSAMAPNSSGDSRNSQRLLNKYAYSLEHTKIGDPDHNYQIRFDHSYRDAPLLLHTAAPDPSAVESIADLWDFHPPYEIGWKDTITITVTHDLALLPGPGRLLAKFVTSPSVPQDKVAGSIAKQANVYTYPLKAQAMLSNLGERSAIPYELKLTSN